MTHDRGQIDLFVDDQLTELEAELRAEGKRSEDALWSESEAAG